MKKRSKKGFTLAELLIVIAIIAILIAIMFPVFGAQLDKARAAADLSNVRAAYSELVADAMLGGKEATDLSALTTEVTVKESDLTNALQYGNKATSGDSNGSVVTVNNSEHKVTVTYKGKYTGSFTVDADVKLTDD